MVGSAANAALMCGTSLRGGCHGNLRKAVTRNTGWKRGGSSSATAKAREFDPRFVPLVLIGDVEVWLSETEPRYLHEAPVEVAA